MTGHDKGFQVEIIVRGVCAKGGHLLVCRSRGGTNTFLPGGHVDFGESAKIALVREIKEEIGLGSRVGRFLGAVEHTFRHKGTQHCEVNLVFRVHIPGVVPGEPVPTCEDWLEFDWIPLKRLAQERVQPHVLQKLLPLWLRGRTAWGSTFR